MSMADAVLGGQPDASSTNTLGISEQSARVIRRCYARWKARRFYHLLRLASTDINKHVADAEGDDSHTVSLKDRDSHHYANVYWTKMRMQQAVTSVDTERTKYYAELMAHELERSDVPGVPDAVGHDASKEPANAERTDEQKEADEASRRNAIFQHEQFERNILRFWSIGPNSGSRPTTGRWKKKQYVAMLVALTKALVPNFHKKAARKTAEQDYRKDSRGENGITWKNFKAGIFELVDSWVDDVDLNRYCDFLEKLFEIITVAPVPPKRARKLRTLRNIKFSESMEVLEQPPYPQLPPLQPTSSFLLDDGEQSADRISFIPPLPFAVQLDDGDAGFAVAREPEAAVDQAQLEQDERREKQLAALQRAHALWSKVNASGRAARSWLNEHRVLSIDDSKIVMLDDDGNKIVGFRGADGLLKLRQDYTWNDDSDDGDGSGSGGRASPDEAVAAQEETESISDSDEDYLSTSSSDSGEANDDVDTANYGMAVAVIKRKAGTDFEQRLRRAKKRRIALVRLQTWWRTRRIRSKFIAATTLKISDHYQSADDAQVVAWMFTPKGRSEIKEFFHPCHRIYRNLVDASKAWHFENIPFTLDGGDTNTFLDITQDRDFPLDVDPEPIFCRVVHAFPFEHLQSKFVDWADEKRMWFTPSGAILYGGEKKAQRSVTMRSDKRLQLRFARGTDRFRHAKLEPQRPACDHVKRSTVHIPQHAVIRGDSSSDSDIEFLDDGNDASAAIAGEEHQTFIKNDDVFVSIGIGQEIHLAQEQTKSHATLLQNAMRALQESSDCIQRADAFRKLALVFESTDCTITEFCQLAPSAIDDIIASLESDTDAIVILEVRVQF